MPARQILILQSLSFLVYVVGSSTNKVGGETTLPAPQQLAGWALLTFILFAMSDLTSTAEVAVAFAWLIFISVLLLYGVDLFDRLSDMVGGKRFNA